MNEYEEMRENLISAIYTSDEDCTLSWAEIIADKLIEKGALMPPVKIGQKVYTTIGQRKYPKEWVVVGVWHSKDFCNFHAYWYLDKHNFESASFSYKDIGNIVYLSKEEAEKHL